MGVQRKDRLQRCGGRVIGANEGTRGSWARFPPPGLEGQGQGMAWCEPGVAGGEEMPPAAVATVRGSPANCTQAVRAWEQGEQTQLSLSSGRQVSCVASCGLNAPETRRQGSPVGLQRSASGCRAGHTRMGS